MKQIVHFIRVYKLFSFALAGLIVAVVLWALHHSSIAHWVLGTLSGIAVLPLLASMWQDIRAGTYGVDVLAATAIIASVVLQQYWAAIVIVIMLSGGESLENFASRRAHGELNALLKRAPQTAHVLRRQKLIDVKANDILVGDKVIIRPGEVVPVDATILEGSGSFDESSLTGESLPQPKKVGDTILSGSVNIEGAITAKALRSAADSQYQQIIRLVESAGASPAPFVRLADRYSIPFTIAAYVIAGTAWVLSGQPIRFLDVIVVATPCPLILATPIALIAGMSRASRDGIIIKNGTALERLAQAKTFAFDKTGTLTKGTPEANTIIAFSPFKQREVLAYAASLEQYSNHILGRATVAFAAVKKIKFPKAKHVKELAGRGLEAQVGGRSILVGQLNFMEERDVKIPRQFDASSVTQTAVFVAIDDKLAGYLTFKDNLRPETKATIKLLKKLGIHRILMVTGDNRTTARAIAKQLGITDIKAEALPSDKLRTIEGIQDRPVAFVGDGVNDAPVLTAADVGIALGARGSTAASESADAVIMQDDLSYVVRAIIIAQRAFQIARQSIFAGIGLSAVLMILFASGRFSPVAGAIAQEVVDVIVIFNALRAHTVKLNAQQV